VHWIVHPEKLWNIRGNMTAPALLAPKRSCQTLYICSMQQQRKCSWESCGC
jgi:hypothetical protein